MLAQIIVIVVVVVADSISWLNILVIVFKRIMNLHCHLIKSTNCSMLSWARATCLRLFLQSIAVCFALQKTKGARASKQIVDLWILKRVCADIVSNARLVLLKHDLININIFRKKTWRNANYCPLLFFLSRHNPITILSPCSSSNRRVSMRTA